VVQHFDEGCPRHPLVSSGWEPEWSRAKAAFHRCYYQVGRKLPAIQKPPVVTVGFSFSVVFNSP